MGEEGAITVLRCPECGYAEITDDGSQWSPRALSDGWCGHDRGQFNAETYVRKDGD
jgi:hypothetical protein